MSRIRALVAPVLVAVLALAGCATETGTASDPEAAASSTEPAAAPSPSDGPAADRGPQPDEDAVVPETLDFTATTVGGEQLDGASLAGTPVLLWFWAPWCPTCLGQVPQVEQLAADHAGDLAVVGVGSLDSEEAIAGFADDVEGVTHLVDTEGALWQRFGIAEQSSFVLLDARGEVAFETGYGGSDELGQQVADVLG
jgi:thiol-disulfide isomerase/thioredoxin